MLELSICKCRVGHICPAIHRNKASRQQIFAVIVGILRYTLTSIKTASATTNPSSERQTADIPAKHDQLPDSEEPLSTGPGHACSHHLRNHVDATSYSVSNNHLLSTRQGSDCRVLRATYANSHQLQIALPPLIEAGAGLGCPSTPVAWPGSIYSLTIRGQS